MDMDFLPERIFNALKKINEDKLYEVRMRVDQPVTCVVGGRRVYLGVFGATLIKQDAIICDEDDINQVISKVTKHSVYAFNEQIKKGYLSAGDGIRIGLGGNCVFDEGGIVTIADVMSLNIRVPHFISGCSKHVFENIVFGNDVYNTLIISPPFCGKTTILKDLAIRINETLKKQILIIDEREEFCDVRGENIDLIVNSDKLYALSYGIRSLSPQIVITDELSNNNDWICVKSAATSGIKIIASCHAGKLKEVIDKDFFIKDVFDRYIVLKSSNVYGYGEIGKIYNADYAEI